MAWTFAAACNTPHVVRVLLFPSSSPLRRQNEVRKVEVDRYKEHSNATKRLELVVKKIPWQASDVNTAEKTSPPPPVLLYSNPRFDPLTLTSLSLLI